MDREGKWDKVIQGYGGPILAAGKIKIQRMPSTPRGRRNRGPTSSGRGPGAIDELDVERVRACKRVPHHRPRGDRHTLHQPRAYWDAGREVYRRDHVEKHYSANVPYGETYLPGHIWGRPPFMIPGEDGEGVIKGTMNHIAPFPRMEMTLKNSVITDIKAGDTSARSCGC